MHSIGAMTKGELEKLLAAAIESIGKFHTDRGYWGTGEDPFGKASQAGNWSDQVEWSSVVGSSAVIKRGDQMEWSSGVVRYGVVECSG